MNPMGPPKHMGFLKGKILFGSIKPHEIFGSIKSITSGGEKWAKFGWVHQITWVPSFLPHAFKNKNYANSESFYEIIFIKKDSYLSERGKKFLLFLPNMKSSWRFNLHFTSLQTQTLHSLQGTPCKSIPTGKTCFHYRGTLFSFQVPCFLYRVFPVFPCTFL